MLNITCSKLSDSVELPTLTVSLHQIEPGAHISPSRCGDSATNDWRWGVSCEAVSRHAGILPLTVSGRQDTRCLGGGDAAASSTAKEAERASIKAASLDPAVTSKIRSS